MCDLHLPVFKETLVSCSEENQNFLWSGSLRGNTGHRTIPDADASEFSEYDGILLSLAKCISGRNSGDYDYHICDDWPNVMEK